MFRYSRVSENRLSTCHPELQLLFREVLKEKDCTIVCGHRNKEDQNKAFDEGYSQLKWPMGNHNAMPSNAVDVIPYPIDWKDTPRIINFAKHVLDVAHRLYDEGKMKHKIRWGGDWDNNPNTPNKFNDLVHYELIPIKK